MSAHPKKKCTNNAYVNKPKLSTRLSTLANTDSAARHAYAYHKLRQLILEVCLASMICHYKSILQKCGAHGCFASDLANAAKEMKLHDDVHPNLPQELVLLEWSKKISSDLEERLCIKRVGVMDADGTSGKSLLAEMAHEVFKDRRQVSMLELASKKDITITSKQAIEIELQAKTIVQQAKEIASSEPKRNS